MEGGPHPDELLGFVRCEGKQAGNQWEAADASLPASVPRELPLSWGAHAVSTTNRACFDPARHLCWEQRLGLQKRIGGADGEVGKCEAEGTYRTIPSGVMSLPVEHSPLPRGAVAGLLGRVQAAALVSTGRDGSVTSGGIFN